MSVGVLGGTFNPIHQAHLRLAEELRETLALDRVLFVPAAHPPLKPAGVAPARDRLEMVRLATAAHPSFSVADVELRRDGPSYTVDTLRALSREWPGERLWFLLGSDALRELDQWREPQDLFELASLAVAPRPGSPARGPRELLPERLATAFSDGPAGLVHPSGNEIRLLPFTQLGISASDIRRRIARGSSVRYLVPDSVLDYIRKHHLYEGREEAV